MPYRYFAGPIEWPLWVILAVYAWQALPFVLISVIGFTLWRFLSMKNSNKNKRTRKKVIKQETIRSISIVILCVLLLCAYYGPRIPEMIQNLNTLGSRDKQTQESIKKINFKVFENTDDTVTGSLEKSIIGPTLYDLEEGNYESYVVLDFGAQWGTKIYQFNIDSIDKNRTNNCGPRSVKKIDTDNYFSKSINKKECRLIGTTSTQGIPVYYDSDYYATIDSTRIRVNLSHYESEEAKTIIDSLRAVDPKTLKVDNTRYYDSE